MLVSKIACNARRSVLIRSNQFSTVCARYAGYYGDRPSSRNFDQDKSNKYGKSPRRNDFSSRGRTNKFNDRNSNYRGGNGYNRNNFSNGGKKFGNRNYEGDDEMLARTAGRRFNDNGLMGQESYELSRGNEIKDLKWTDLIPENAEENQPETAGVSSVPTSQLATKRLISLPLVNSLIHNRNYKWLTPVQAQTLLPILQDESVVVRAKTGTGKTAAFSIPIIQKVLEAKEKDPSSNQVHALIVSPTRELAQQIADEIYKITQFGGLDKIRVQSLVGGVAKDRQIKAAGLDGSRNVADIIVATPGRLVDVLSEGNIAAKYFHSLSARVLDEADQILDIGFEREMERARQIIDGVSTKSEIPLLLFSATADRKMQKFAQTQFGDRVKVVDTIPKNEPTANELVEQHSVACKNWAEIFESASREIVDSYEKAKDEGAHFKAIVFLPTTLLVDQYERVLRKVFGRQSRLFNLILGIHGQRKQQSRQVRADRFRKEPDAVLITTDVVARGMDFPNVTHVFQLGPPPDVASYVHRIGRTARIGNNGKSYLYYTNHMRGYVDALAREGIKPAMSIYQPDNEDFTHRLEDAFSATIDSDDEAQELLMSLMAYMTVLKSKYNIIPQDFMKDMTPFVQLLGLEQLKLSTQMRQTWSSRGGPHRFQNKKGFGSSRKTKMRW